MAIIEFFLQLVAMERFPSGAHDKFKRKSTNELAYVQSDMIERKDPLFAVFRQNLRRVDFQDFVLLQLNRLQLTVVCCNRQGCVKTTPHKSIFAMWISTRNSRTSQKMNKFGALATSEFGTQSDKPNNMWNELKHV